MKNTQKKAVTSVTAATNKSQRDAVNQSQKALTAADAGGAAAPVSAEGDVSNVETGSQEAETAMATTEAAVHKASEDAAPEAAAAADSEESTGKMPRAQEETVAGYLEKAADTALKNAAGVVRRLGFRGARALKEKTAAIRAAVVAAERELDEILALDREMADSSNADSKGAEAGSSTSGTKADMGAGSKAKTNAGKDRTDSKEDAEERMTYREETRPERPRPSFLSHIRRGFWD